MAATRSRFTTGWTLALSLICLLWFAESGQAEERLELMKEQLKQVEQYIASWKMKIESERLSIFEILEGNTQRMKCIREHSLAPDPVVELMEDYTDNTNQNVRRSFANMAARVQELEARLEDMKAQVKFAEHFPFGSNTMMF